MRGLTRSLCIWWLALALPVHGWAAAAMLFCATGSRHPAHVEAAAHTASQVHNSVHVLHGAHQTSDGSRSQAGQLPLAKDAVPHCHGHATSLSDQGLPQVENADAPGLMSPHGPCSVCMDCCFMLGLPALQALVAPAPTAEQLHSPRVQMVSSRATDTPDRPPRTCVA